MQTLNTFFPKRGKTKCSFVSIHCCCGKIWNGVIEIRSRWSPFFFFFFFSGRCCCVSAEVEGAGREGASDAQWLFRWCFLSNMASVFVVRTNPGATLPPPYCSFLCSTEEGGTFSQIQLTWILNVIIHSLYPFPFTLYRDGLAFQCGLEIWEHFFWDISSFSLKFHESEKKTKRRLKAAWRENPLCDCRAFVPHLTGVCVYYVWHI